MAFLAPAPGEPLEPAVMNVTVAILTRGCPLPPEAADGLAVHPHVRMALAASDGLMCPAEGKR